MSAGEKYLASAKKDEPPKNRHHPRKPPEEKHRQVAKDVLRKGKTISEALVVAGYSPTQAKTGMRVVERSNPLRVAFQEEAAKIEKELAEAPLVPNSWNAREQLILNRLEKNIKAGKDGGALSCKLLGSHKSLALWEVEYKQGVIIVTPPQVIMPILPVPDTDD